MQVRIPKINPKACLIYKSLLCFCFPVSSVMFLWLTHTSKNVCSASCPAPHAPQLQRKCLENRFSYPPPSECNVALERLCAPPTMCMCAIRTCMCIAVACALTLHPHAVRSCICSPCATICSSPCHKTATRNTKWEHRRSFQSFLDQLPEGRSRAPRGCRPARGSGVKRSQVRCRLTECVRPHS
jgi:hypothetical protein